MRFLLIGLIVVGLSLFLRWQYRQSPQRLYLWLACLVGGALLLLVFTGRAHWMLGVLGGVLPFLGKAALLFRWWPALSWIWRRFGAGPVRMQTPWLEVSIDRRSGAMDGVVRQGEFEGRKLSELELAQLETLLDACQADSQSAALLRAYLSRTHAGWQASGSAGAEADGDFDDATVSEKTAAQILGVSPNASESEIRAAHRSLAQKLHPDRGGNDYLTRKINQARDVLLKKRQTR